MNEKTNSLSAMPAEADIEHEIKKIQNPFFVGLFWFSDDYSSLVRTEGLIEVPAEILFSDRSCNIDPDTCHLEYEKDLSIPRGRIAFSDGVFDICVGTDVPSNINTQAVKEAFGLAQLDDSKVQIFHDPHWNTKGQRRHK